MVRRIAEGVKIQDRSAGSVTDQVQFGGELNLAVEVLAESSLNGLRTELGLLQRSPEVVLSSAILREPVKGQLDNIVYQHQREPIEVAISNRELVECEVQLIDAVDEKLDHGVDAW